MTGLTRKVVKRLKEGTAAPSYQLAKRYNRAARVIAAWRRESDFLDAECKPVALPMEGQGATFSELVKRFSGNMPPRAVLDELINVGAVKLMEDGRVCLLTRAYIPKNLDAHKLNILGTDVQYLISTIDHNLSPAPATQLFQRKVAYDNLPDDVLPQFHKLFARKAQSLLESADRWLAQRDHDINSNVEGAGRNKAGFGIFFFEESNLEGS